MDTNLLAVLQALANTKTENNSGTSTAQIIGMVLVALPSIIAAIASSGAWLKSKATEKINAKTAEQVVKIHEAVNSERTAMTAKVESMHQEIRGLSGSNRGHCRNLGDCSVSFAVDARWHQEAWRSRSDHFHVNRSAHYQRHGSSG